MRTARSVEETLAHLRLTKKLLANGKLWTQGQTFDRQTEQRCLIGALRKAEAELGYFSTESFTILRDLAIPDKQLAHLAAWNDVITRSWKQVEELLDRAIEICEIRWHGSGN